MNVQKVIAMLAAFLLLPGVTGPLRAQDAAARIAQLKPAAEKGDAAAQDKLGDAYAMRFDYANALAWYRKAAAQGVANSQFGVGRMLMRQGVDWSGKITSRANVDEALQWYAKAAKQGHVQSQIDLGQFHEKGDLVAKDLVEAYKWYGVAAKSEAPDPAVEFAKGYRDGLAAKLTKEQLADGEKRVGKFLAELKASRAKQKPPSSK